MNSFSLALTTMSESLIISLSGRTSTLENHFFPPIELSGDKNYALGLVKLLTFNSIPNLEKKNFYVADLETINIPTGSYEIEDINKFLSDKLKLENVTFSLKANNNTLQSTIECDRDIDFTKADSIGELLGFDPQILKAGESHTSKHPISIIKINSLRIECNITRGSYSDGKEVHYIHEFFPAVPPGFKIIEKPLEIIYLPISVKRIDYLIVRIVDQDGDIVNFRGETVTVRLHLKSI